MEEEEAKLEGDMPIYDHVDKQDYLEGPHLGQLPVVINAITTTSRTSEGEMVWDPVPDQLEQHSESERGISTRLPVMVDTNTPPPT